jgi:hypothetical protein
VLEELALLLPLLVLFAIDEDELDDTAGTDEDADFEEEEGGVKLCDVFVA